LPGNRTGDHPKPVSVALAPAPPGRNCVAPGTRKLHAPAIKPDQPWFFIRWNKNMIKAIIGAAVILVIATSAASAQHRAGDAALGAVSGAVVLGPIGAVAGAFIGYSAGPSIARSWGLDRSRSSRQRQQASNNQAPSDNVRSARAEAVSAGTSRPAAAEKNPHIAGNAPAAPPARSAKAPKAPPVQTLE
jgi:predicted lipid-binding transport protein (Tim44 family)